MQQRSTVHHEDTSRSTMWCTTGRHKLEVVTDYLSTSKASAVSRRYIHP